MKNIKYILLSLALAAHAAVPAYGIISVKIDGKNVSGIAKNIVKKNGSFLLVWVLWALLPQLVP